MQYLLQQYIQYQIYLLCCLKDIFSRSKLMVKLFSFSYFSISTDHTLCWILGIQAHSLLYPSVSIAQMGTITNYPSLLRLSMSQEWVVPLMACFCPRTSICHFIPGDTFQGIKTIAGEDFPLTDCVMEMGEQFYYESIFKRVRKITIFEIFTLVEKAIKFSPA